jgi:hypothetical protein
MLLPFSLNLFILSKIVQNYISYISCANIDLCSLIRLSVENIWGSDFTASFTSIFGPLKCVTSSESLFMPPSTRFCSSLSKSNFSIHTEQGFDYLSVTVLPFRRLTLLNQNCKMHSSSKHTYFYNKYVSVIYVYLARLLFIQVCIRATEINFLFISSNL